MGLIITGENEIFTILFPNSGTEVKHGVEFHHSTCNASKFGGKWRTERLNTSYIPSPTMCAKKLKKNLFTIRAGLKFITTSLHCYFIKYFAKYSKCNLNMK